MCKYAYSTLGTLLPSSDTTRISDRLYNPFKGSDPEIGLINLLWRTNGVAGVRRHLYYSFTSSAIHNSLKSFQKLLLSGLSTSFPYLFHGLSILKYSANPPGP
jgi:hypothetical protein